SPRRPVVVDRVRDPAADGGASGPHGADGASRGGPFDHRARTARPSAARVARVARRAGFAGGTVTTLPAVRGKGIRHCFGDTVAVDGVDVDVAAGTVFGLLGPNGAGKTTTLRMITTLLPAPAGTIEVFGIDVARHKLAVRRLIGYVPQQLSADGTLSGRENVALFARLFDVP